MNLRTTALGKVLGTNGPVEEIVGKNYVDIENDHGETLRYRKHANGRGLIAHGAKVHPTAIVEAGAYVEPGVQIAAGARIGRGVWIESDALIGPEVVVAPHAHIGPGAAIGAGSKIGIRTVIGAHRSPIVVGGWLLGHVRHGQVSAGGVGNVSL